MICDLKAPITLERNFVWSEALLLREWGVHCFPVNENVKSNIIKTAERLEAIRRMLQCSLLITSWYRPTMYNIEIGGARHSAHVQGLAVDFKPMGLDIQEAKKHLSYNLISLGIRMEDNGKGNWIHIDLIDPGIHGKRHFLP